MRIPAIVTSCVNFFWVRQVGHPNFLSVQSETDPSVMARLVCVRYKPIQLTLNELLDGNDMRQ